MPSPAPRNRTIFVAAVLFVAALGCAASPATSDWAFLSPFWHGVGMPVAAILSLRSVVNPDLNMFAGPVPFPSMSTINAGWNGHVTF